ncbi:MAG: hypothetical protein ABWY93_02120 [Mycobacterium sp.]
MTGSRASSTAIRDFAVLLAGLVGRAEHHFVDAVRLDAAAVDDGSHHEGCQVVGGVAPSAPP